MSRSSSEKLFCIAYMLLPGVVLRIAILARLHYYRNNLFGHTPPKTHCTLVQFCCIAAEYGTIAMQQKDYSCLLLTAVLADIVHRHDAGHCGFSGQETFNQWDDTFQHKSATEKAYHAANLRTATLQASPHSPKSQKWTSCSPHGDRTAVFVGPLWGIFAEHPAAFMSVLLQVCISLHGPLCDLSGSYLP